MEQAFSRYLAKAHSGFYSAQSPAQIKYTRSPPNIINRYRGARRSASFFLSILCFFFNLSFVSSSFFHLFSIVRFLFLLSFSFFVSSSFISSESKFHYEPFILCVRDRRPRLVVASAKRRPTDGHDKRRNRACTELTSLYAKKQPLSREEAETVKFSYAGDRNTEIVYPSVFDRRWNDTSFRAFYSRRNIRQKTYSSKYPCSNFTIFENWIQHLFLVYYERPFDASLNRWNYRIDPRKNFPKAANTKKILLFSTLKIYIQEIESQKSSERSRFVEISRETASSLSPLSVASWQSIISRAGRASSGAERVRSERV